MKNNRNLSVVTDFLGKTYEIDCLGCEIAKKRITPPGGIIYEDEVFLLACDPLIPLEGFLIVNVKKHIKSIIELNTSEQHRMIEIISKCVSILKELHIATEVTLIQEERSSHFHVWILPNQEWMSQKFGNGVSYVRDIFEYVKENATPEDKDKILQTIDKIKIMLNKM